MSWTNVRCETGAETPKAIELNFENGDTAGSYANKWMWVPKSCYRVVRDGNFDIQQVKTWFIAKNSLWNRA